MLTNYEAEIIPSRITKCTKKNELYMVPLMKRLRLILLFVYRLSCQHDESRTTLSGNIRTIWVFFVTTQMLLAFPDRVVSYRCCRLCTRMYLFLNQEAAMIMPRLSNWSTHY